MEQSDDSVEIQSQVEAPVSAPPPVQEKMVPQSTMDSVVGRIKRETEDRVRREYEQSVGQRQASQAPSMGGMTREEVESLWSQKEQEREQIKFQQTNLQNATKEANSFMEKLRAGATLHPDFDEVVSVDETPWHNMTNIVRLANGVENTANVIYELKKNPAKIGALIALSHADPLGAKREMSRLSESIKLNEAAAQAKTAKAPLSQIRPTHVGVDNGPETVTDFRAMLRNRR